MTPHWHQGATEGFNLGHVFLALYFAESSIWKKPTNAVIDSGRRWSTTPYPHYKVDFVPAPGAPRLRDIDLMYHFYGMQNRVIISWSLWSATLTSVDQPEVVFGEMRVIIDLGQTFGLLEIPAAPGETQVMNSTISLPNALFNYRLEVSVEYKGYQFGVRPWLRHFSGMMDCFLYKDRRQEVVPVPGYPHSSVCWYQSLLSHEQPIRMVSYVQILDRPPGQGPLRWEEVEFLLRTTLMKVVASTRNYQQLKSRLHKNRRVVAVLNILFDVPTQSRQKNITNS